MAPSAARAAGPAPTGEGGQGDRGSVSSGNPGLRAQPPLAAPLPHHPPHLLCREARSRRAPFFCFRAVLSPTMLPFVNAFESGMYWRCRDGDLDDPGLFALLTVWSRKLSIKRCRILKLLSNNQAASYRPPHSAHDKIFLYIPDTLGNNAARGHNVHRCYRDNRSYWDRDSGNERGPPTKAPSKRIPDLVSFFRSFLY